MRKDDEVDVSHLLLTLFFNVCLIMTADAVRVFYMCINNLQLKLVSCHPETTFLLFFPIKHLTYFGISMSNVIYKY